MKVILSQEIKNIGKVGDVVTVKDGFARNFLIPQKKAYLSTSVNIKKIEQKRAQEKNSGYDRKVGKKTWCESERVECQKNENPLGYL